MEYSGCAIRTGEGRIEIASRPRPRQRLLFIAPLIIGPLAAAGGIAAGQIAAAIGVLVVSAGLAVFFYRELMIASRERLEYEPDGDGMLRWVKVRGLKTETSEMPLYDITPDARGNQLMVKVFVHNAPGSKTLEGSPATLWIDMSLGEGAGYSTLYKVRTLEKDVDQIVNTLVEHLPAAGEKRFT